MKSRLIGNRVAPIKLSIVVPVFNEEKVVSSLVQCLGQTFAPDVCEKHALSSVSFIFVDDGSSDETFNLLLEHASRLPSAKVIKLSRNFGHQSAVSCGLMNSENFDVTAIIDGDLQDPPEVILQMIAKWREGFDVVYGVRKNRKEPLYKKVAYWSFYRIYRAMSPIYVPLDSGDFCVMARKVVLELNSLPEKLRFARGLRSWVGFRQCGLEYSRPKRELGESKYTFRMLYNLATDGIVSLSVRPMQISQALALLYIIGSIVVAGYFFSSFIQASKDDLRFYGLLGIVLLSSGLNLVCLHVIGAYVSRSYVEIKNRPNFIVDEVIDFSQ